MTEDEAIALICEQFAGPSGFIAGLRHGEGLSSSSVDGVFTALDVLEYAWVGMDYVPKQAVWAMAHVDNNIGSLGNQYPNLDLEMLEIRLIERMEQCLAPGNWAEVAERFAPGSPERLWTDAFYSDADASFLMMLHEGKGIDDRTVAELFDALEALYAEWMGRERIHKAIGLVLATASGLISGRWGIYRNAPDQGQSILRLASEMQSRIIQCLSDEEHSMFTQMKMDLAVHSAKSIACDKRYTSCAGAPAPWDGGAWRVLRLRSGGHARA